MRIYPSIRTRREPDHNCASIVERPTEKYNTTREVEIERQVDLIALGYIERGILKHEDRESFKCPEIYQHIGCTLDNIVIKNREKHDTLHHEPINHHVEFPSIEYSGDHEIERAVTCTKIKKCSTRAKSQKSYYMEQYMEQTPMPNPVVISHFVQPRPKRPPVQIPVHSHRGFRRPIRDEIKKQEAKENKSNFEKFKVEFSEFEIKQRKVKAAIRKEFPISDSLIRTVLMPSKASTPVRKAIKKSVKYDLPSAYIAKNVEFENILKSTKEETQEKRNGLNIIKVVEMNEIETQTEPNEDINGNEIQCNESPMGQSQEPEYKQPENPRAPSKSQSQTLVFSRVKALPVKNKCDQPIELTPLTQLPVKREKAAIVGVKKALPKRKNCMKTSKRKSSAKGPLQPKFEAKTEQSGGDHYLILNNLFKFKVNLSGFNPEEIFLKIDGRRLSIHAERRNSTNYAHCSSRKVNEVIDLPLTVKLKNLKIYLSNGGWLNIEETMATQPFIDIISNPPPIEKPKNPLPFWNI